MQMPSLETIRRSIAAGQLAEASKPPVTGAFDSVDAFRDFVANNQVMLPPQFRVMDTYQDLTHDKSEYLRFIALPETAAIVYVVGVPTMRGQAHITTLYVPEFTDLIQNPEHRGRVPLIDAQQDMNPPRHFGHWRLFSRTTGEMSYIHGNVDTLGIDAAGRYNEWRTFADLSAAQRYQQEVRYRDVRETRPGMDRNRLS